MSLTQRDCLSCLSLFALGPRSSGTAQRNEPTWNRPLTWERNGRFLCRVALGAPSFLLSLTAFGPLGKYGGWGNFANFTDARRKLTSLYLRHSPFFAWTATVAETCSEFS